MKNEKKQYSRPELTVVSFACERGFAGSTGNITANPPVETMTEKTGFGNSADNNSFWN